jgi:Skp family chaperone for outer membrane proteins
MNPKLSIVAALVAGLLPVAVAAQTTPAAPTAAPAAVPTEAKLPPPAAFPAKIALVNFIGAVEATNEGQRAAADVGTKYEPKKEKLQSQAAELDALKKKLQSAPATMPDDERNRLVRDIDAKDKILQRDEEDAQNSFQSEMNDGLQKVAAKVHDFMIGYVSKNGYTLLLNYGDQQSPLIWAAQDQNADITEAIIDGYNKASGVAPPAPSAPSAPSTGAGAPAHRPAGTTGATHSTTTPHTTTPTK